MRIGLISDIHSNIDALHAVYQEFEERQVDKVICLGDIIGLGAHPEECIQFLKNHQDKILSIVKGNHEDYLLEELPIYNHNNKNLDKLPKEIIDLFKWNHGQISDDSIEYLRQLPRQQTVEVEKSKIFVSHYPIDQLGGYRKFYYRPDSAQCQQLFKGIKADIYLFGHTHIRCIVKPRTGTLYINPGSVGCPIGIEAASAGILTVEKRKISYEQIDIAYDVDRTIDDMMQYSDKLPAIDYTVNRFYRMLND